MSLRRLLPVVVALAVWPSAAEAEVQLAPVGSFSSPRHVSAPAGDYSRLFVVEGAGRIRLVKNGVLLPDPFLDISAQVAQVGEGGLLSVAFPPDYATSGRFYVYYTLQNGATGACASDQADADVCPPIRVEEYLRSAADPDLANPGSARALLTFAHGDFGNHYGGQLAFGPDGLLYVGTGDGGGGGDPLGNAGDTGSPLGKLLRLDPVGGAAGQYSLFAYGLRNPFRFSFDRGSGDLLVGDVGQGSWEEVDLVSAGAAAPLDFGWNACEGAHVYPPTTPPSPCGTGLAPAFEYAHEGSSCTGTVIGGFVVRDPGLESELGRYVYADYCKDYVRSIALASPGPPVQLLTPEAPVSFGEDACGRIYLAQLGGAVSRLEDGSPAACPPAGGGGGGGGAGGTGGGGSGGVGGGGEGGGGAGAAPDSTAPTLVLAGPRRQRLRRRGLLVRVTCGEACRVRALALASVPGAARTLRFQEVRRPLAAGVSYSLRLRLSDARRRLVRSALRSGDRVRARVVIRVRDEAGNLRVGRRRVSLVL